MTSFPNQILPWGTLTLVVGSATAFVVTGTATATAYRSAGPKGTEDLSIGVLIVNTFRHPDVFVLLATLIVVTPVAIAVERVVGAVGVASVYLVAGFSAGFLEAAQATALAPVAGAFGGTTALLTMWAVIRWRRRGDLILASAAIAGWLLATTVLRQGPFPLLGCGIAICIGLYAIDATPRRAGRAEVRGK